MTGPGFNTVSKGLCTCCPHLRVPSRRTRDIVVRRAVVVGLALTGLPHARPVSRRLLPTSISHAWRTALSDLPPSLEPSAFQPLSKLLRFSDSSSSPDSFSVPRRRDTREAASQTTAAATTVASVVMLLSVLSQALPLMAESPRMLQRHICSSLSPLFLHSAAGLCSVTKPAFRESGLRIPTSCRMSLHSVPQWKCLQARMPWPTAAHTCVHQSVPEGPYTTRICCNLFNNALSPPLGILSQGCSIPEAC